MSHYDTLGVGKDFTPDELKAAKRNAQRHAHPDKGGSHQQMVAVNKAYDTLSDPKKREYYDLHGEDELPRPSLEKRALQTIHSILLQLAEQVADEDADLVAVVTENLRINRNTIKNKGPGFLRKIRKLEAQAKRIRRKTDGDNLLTMVFDQRIAALKEKLREIEEGLATADKALEIIAEYEHTGPSRRHNPLDAATNLNRLIFEAMKNG